MPISGTPPSPKGSVGSTGSVTPTGSAAATPVQPEGSIASSLGVVKGTVGNSPPLTAGSVGSSPVPSPAGGIAQTVHGALGSVDTSVPGAVGSLLHTQVSRAGGVGRTVPLLELNNDVDVDDESAWNFSYQLPVNWEFDSSSLLFDGDSKSWVGVDTDNFVATHGTTYIITIDIADYVADNTGQHLPDFEANWGWLYVSAGGWWNQEEKIDLTDKPSSFTVEVIQTADTTWAEDDPTTWIGAACSLLLPGSISLRVQRVSIMEYPVPSPPSKGSIGPT